MLGRSVIRARIDYECYTSIAKFTPVTTIFFLLNKICDGGSSKETFLKAATLSILIWLIHAKRKQTIGILKMPPFCRVRLLTGDEHAHSFCRCVGGVDYAEKKWRFKRKNKKIKKYFSRKI